jgi:hypothetical protein
MFIIANGDRVWGEIGNRSGSYKEFTTRTRRVVKYKTRAGAERIVKRYTSYLTLSPEERAAVMRQWDLWGTYNEENAVLFAGAEILSVDI